MTLEQYQELIRYQVSDKTDQAPPPKVRFPETAKRIENPSLNKEGKHKAKKPVNKNQPTLWKSKTNPS